MNLSGNLLTNFDPSLFLPISLLSLDIGVNRLTSFSPFRALPSGLKNLVLSRNSITSFAPSTVLPLSLSYIAVNANPIDETEVNNSLVYLDAIVWTSAPPKLIDLTSSIGSAIPSGAGAIAKTNLQLEGWTVNTR